MLVLIGWQFPQVTGNGEQMMRLLYLVALLGLVGGGVFFRPRHLAKRKMLIYTVIWLAVILGLILFYELLRSFGHHP